MSSNDNFLNKDGATHFWSGIKNYITQKFNTLGTASTKNAVNIMSSTGTNVPTEKAVAIYISAQDVILPINPSQTPTTPGAIWIETN